MRKINPKAIVTMNQFGKVVPNDHPIRTQFKFMIAGKSRDYWYVDHLGRPPIFQTYAAAEKVIRRLYRQFGHLVTLGQCRYAFRRQRACIEQNRRQFALAVAMDIGAGRARIRNGCLEIAGLGSAPLA